MTCGALNDGWEPIDLGDWDIDAEWAKIALGDLDLDRVIDELRGWDLETFGPALAEIRMSDDLGGDG